MVLKIYVSGISASKEVKKRQQRALLLLDSAKVDYESIDITEPGREEEREQVQSQFKTQNGSVNPLPPQFFKDDEYLGDYEDFCTAVDNNIEDIYTFLRLESRKEEILNEIKQQQAANTNQQEVITNGNSQETNENKDDNEDDETEIVESQSDRGQIVSEKTEVIGEYSTRQKFKVDEEGKVGEEIVEVKDEVSEAEQEESQEHEEEKEPQEQKKEPQEEEPPKVAESSSEEEEEEDQDE